MAGSTRLPAPSFTDTPATAHGVRLCTFWLSHGRESLLTRGFAGQHDGDVVPGRPRGLWAAFPCTAPELLGGSSPSAGLQASVSSATEHSACLTP